MGYSSWGRERIGHNLRIERAHMLGIPPGVGLLYRMATPFLAL